MTKKILALALAGTTAFSMFGAGLSVNAGWTDHDGDPSTPDVYVWDSGTTNNYDSAAFEKLTPVVSPTLTAGGISNFTDLAKISFEDVTDELFVYDKDKYYVADWKVKASATDVQIAAFETAVKAAIAAGSSGWATHKISVDAALAAAYDTTGSTVIAFKDSNSKDSDLTAAYTQFVKNYDHVKDYITAGVVDPAKVAVDYDVADFDAYDANVLFATINTSYAAAAFALPLSYYTYLNNEYSRIMGMVEEADKSSLIDDYEHFLEATTTLTEEDYTATNWASITHNIRLAEIKAADGKYADAVAYLKTALNTTPVKGSYAELQATLMSMYADAKGQTKATYIKKDYFAANGTPAAYAIYERADYTVKNNVYTDEWNALFEDKIWYYNPLDAVAADNAHSSLTYDGIYGYAYALYTEARTTKVAQSRLDIANEMLQAALADLDPTSSSPEWEMVKLEKTVELAESLVDTDFNTNSTKWKTFAKNLEKAQEILGKDNAGKSTVTNVMNALNDSMIALKSVAKNPSYTLKKEFKDTLKEAKDTLKGLKDQNAAQYKALQTAIENAENLGTWLDVNEKSSFTELPSDYEESIAEMEAAIAGFVQTQGWYQQGGKWMYGEGDSYYTDGWHKINASWYYFNADGTAKQNEWFKDTDGEWYWFTNNANAAYGWAKVDGEWYYFKGGCKMVTGWAKVNGGWYYLNPDNGKMMTGWVKVNNKWYYLSKESNAYGKMLENTTTPDGYKVGPDGAMI